MYKVLLAQQELQAVQARLVLRALRALRALIQQFLGLRVPKVYRASKGLLGLLVQHLQCRVRLALLAPQVLLAQRDKLARTLRFLVPLVQQGLQETLDLKVLKAFRE